MKIYTRLKSGITFNELVYSVLCCAGYNVGISDNEKASE